MYLRIVLAASLLVFPGVAEAQQKIDDVDAFRALLSRDSSVTTLRAREQTLHPQIKKDPEAMLERGLVLMRLYEIEGVDRDISHARGDLERAADRFPTDARFHYAYALSNSVGHGVRVWSPAGVLNGMVLTQSVAEIIKLDPISKAKGSFKKALVINPLMTNAALGLARLSLDSRDKDNLRTAAAALRNMQQKNHGGAAVATMLSNVESALGNLAAAEAAASSATEMETASSAALRAQAAALLRQKGKAEAGARAYFAGVELLDAAAADEYFEDILPVANDAERAQWARANLESRKEFLQKFWNMRAAGSGTTVGERMAEHYIRLAAAHDRYRRIGQRGAAPGGSLVLAKYNADALPFDDRGLILVRHGEPDETVRTSDVDLRPNETWVYRSTNASSKNTLYNFVQLRDGTDFRLVDDVLYALDPSTRGIPGEAAYKLLTDRQAYEPRYAALAASYSAFNSASRRGTAEFAAGNIAERRTRMAEEMRTIALEGLSTDSDQPDFTGDLPFYYDIYSFKGESNQTQVTVAAAIPGLSVSGQQVGAQFIYSIQASLIIIDTATAEVVRKDTVLTMRSPRMLGESEHLRLHMDLNAPYTKTGVHRVVIRDLITPGKGQLYGGDADIKNFTATTLTLSDIVLAEPDNGTWQRGDVKLGLVPPRQFVEGRPLRLFYEIYNLPQNTDYRTEIIMEPMEGESGFGRIKKLFGGGGKGVQMQFDGVAAPAPSGAVQEMKQVTAQVKPGRYRVTVRVTNLQNSQSVRSETVFVVLKGS